MGLSKAKTKAASAGPVTRDEFDALSREFAAFRRVAAIAFMAAQESAKYPGVHGGPGSAGLRLEKIASAGRELFELDDAELRELRQFLSLIEQARDGERDREAAEVRARDNLRNNPWLPDGTYGRRIV